MREPSRLLSKAVVGRTSLPLATIRSGVNKHAEATTRFYTPTACPPKSAPQRQCRRSKRICSLTVQPRSAQLHNAFGKRAPRVRMPSTPLCSQCILKGPQPSRPAPVGLARRQNKSTSARSAALVQRACVGAWSPLPLERWEVRECWGLRELDMLCETGRCGGAGAAISKLAVRKLGHCEKASIEREKRGERRVVDIGRHTLSSFRGV